MRFFKKYCFELITLSLTIILFSIIILIIGCERNPVNSNTDPSDEERILFIRNVKDKLSQICTMKHDGSDIKIISQSEFSYYNRGYQHARWSPDKTKIVGVGGPEGSGDIFPLWLIDMNGNFLRKLSHNGWHPIWKTNNEIIYHKPQGPSIASRHDIYLINIIENKEFIIYQQTDTLAITISDFHTAGDYGIGYLWDKSMGLEKEPIITKLQINNWHNYETLYDKHTVQGVQPKLSQNEEYLIFVKGIYRNRDIYLLELASKTVTNLTNALAEYRSLVWSPNSKKILFTKEKDIFVLDLQTKTIDNITNSAQDSISNRAMDWK